MDLPYQLIDAKFADRVNSFLKMEHPTDLTPELAMLRGMAEEALNAKDIPLAESLFKTLGKLTQVVEAAKIKRGDLLAKAALIQIGQRIVQALADNIAGRFPGWEDALLGTQKEILTIVCEAENPDSVTQLEGKAKL